MQNEEVSRQIYSVVCNTAKQGLQMALNYFMNKSIYGKITQNGQKPELPHGEQSLQSLYQHGQPMLSIVVKGDEKLHEFRKTASKYNLDFAIQHDPETKKHTVYFKSRDNSVIDKILTKYGEQSLEDLQFQKQPLSSVDISGDSSLRNFRDIAARYNVDFAVKQNPKSKQYVIFFKARDSEIMERVSKEFRKQDLKAKDSVLDKLANHQEKVKEMAKEAEKTMENGVKKGMEKVNENIERTL